jgi:hypothetical protein
LKHTSRIAPTGGNHEYAAQRKVFFELAARYEEKIFMGIAQTAEAGGREFSPGSIPEFDQECKNLFLLSGMYNRDMMNDWLYARDLSHLFRSTSTTLFW